MSRDTHACQICGKKWSATDPGVTHWAIGDEWACTEEGPCFERAAMNTLTEETGADT